MRRADRLFEIIQQLRGDRLVTAQTLAEKLEVSVRTVYRDIRDLQAVGRPDRRRGRRRLPAAARLSSCRR